MLKTYLVVKQIFLSQKWTTIKFVITSLNGKILLSWLSVSLYSYKVKTQKINPHKRVKYKALFIKFDVHIILISMLCFLLTHSQNQAINALWNDPHFIAIFTVLTPFDNPIIKPCNVLWNDQHVIVLFHVWTPFIIHLIDNVPSWHDDWWFLSTVMFNL